MRRQQAPPSQAPPLHEAPHTKGGDSALTPHSRWLDLSAEEENKTPMQQPAMALLRYKQKEGFLLLQRQTRERHIFNFVSFLNFTVHLTIVALFFLVWCLCFVVIARNKPIRSFCDHSSFSYTNPFRRNVVMIYNGEKCLPML